MKMGKKVVITTLPAMVVGVCATAIGQFQGTAGQQVPQISQTQSFSTSGAKPAALNPRALSDGNGPLGGQGAPGGGAGGQCVFFNGGPLDDFGAAASQKDPDNPPYVFFAEAADDFVLPGVGPNDCEISQVRFWVSQGIDPLDSWTALKITIYEDEVIGGPVFSFV